MEESSDPANDEEAGPANDEEADPANDEEAEIKSELEMECKEPNYNDNETVSSSASESADSESSSESGESIRAPLEMMLEEENDGIDPNVAPRTKNEVVETEASLVEEVQLVVSAGDEVQVCGRVVQVIASEQSIVVRANLDSQPLDVDSVLCDEDRVPIGKVCDVFGPVCSPFYVVRVPKYKLASIDEGASDAAKVSSRIASSSSSSICVDSVVFCVTKQSVFVSPTHMTHMSSTKGTDASNLYDEELPPEEQEFSDDEAEQRAKKARSKHKTKTILLPAVEASRDDDQRPRIPLPAPSYYQVPHYVAAQQLPQGVYGGMGTYGASALGPQPSYQPAYPHPQYPAGAMMMQQQMQMQFSSANYVPGVGFVQMPPSSFPSTSAPFGGGAYYPQMPQTQTQTQYPQMSALPPYQQPPLPPHPSDTRYRHTGTPEPPWPPR
jgi:H/ACA ribonucleoprotein complex non-core subunit NAF1